MTIDVGDVLQVVQTWTTPGNEVAQNVWHLEMVSGAGADEVDILAALNTQQDVAMGAIDSYINTGFEIVEIALLKRNLSTHEWDGLGSTQLTASAGASASDYLPHGVAMVCRYQTALARRQGRQFIPGWVDAAVLDGVFASTYLAAAAAYMGYWGTDISVTGGLLQVCTYNVEPASAYYESSSLANGTYLINEVPGYQRRRKPGVGI